MINLTLEDVNAFEDYMKLHDTDANNVNSPPLKYKYVCAAARYWLEDQAKTATRSAKVQKVQPVEVPTPAVVGGPDAEIKGNNQ